MSTRMKTLLTILIVALAVGCESEPSIDMDSTYKLAKSAFDLGRTTALAGMSHEEAEAVWNGCMTGHKK